MSDIEIPTRDTITDLCRQHGFSKNGFAYSDHIWVKYGTTVYLAEAEIQRHVHRHCNPDLVRIPKVYDAFISSTEDGYPITCIVMEYVKGEDCASYMKRHAGSTEGTQTIEAVARAVRHIWSIPVPQSSPPGPFSGQKPCDRFFSDYGCDRTFSNLQELEDWINDQLREVQSLERITLEGEQMFICHCDLSQFNIFVGKPIAIIDWGFSGIYPRCFEEFALYHQFWLDGAKFAKALHKELFGPELSKSIWPLARAARYNLLGS